MSMYLCNRTYISVTTIGFNTLIDTLTVTPFMDIYIIFIVGIILMN